MPYDVCAIYLADAYQHLRTAVEDNNNLHLTPTELPQTTLTQLIART